MTDRHVHVSASGKRILRSGAAYVRRWPAWTGIGSILTAFWIVCVTSAGAQEDALDLAMLNLRIWEVRTVSDLVSSQSPSSYAGHEWSKLVVVTLRASSVPKGSRIALTPTAFSASYRTAEGLSSTSSVAIQDGSPKFGDWSIAVPGSQSLTSVVWRTLESNTGPLFLEVAFELPKEVTTFTVRYPADLSPPARIPEGGPQLRLSSSAETTVQGSPREGMPNTTSSRPAIPEKVAIVDLKLSINSTRDGREAARELNAWAEARKEELWQLQQEVAALQQRLRQDQSYQSGRIYSEKYQTYQREWLAAEVEFARRNKQAVHAIADRMATVVDRYASAEGYDLVLTSPLIPGPIDVNTSVFWNGHGVTPEGYSYLGKETDITASLASFYDQFSADGQTPTPTTSAPAPNILVASDPAAGDAIDRIRRGNHTTLPTVEEAPAAGPVGKGLTVENHSPFTLQLYFRGPMSHSITIAPGESHGLELLTGEYEVAAEALHAPVVPFYGRQSYAPNTHYWLRFYSATRP